ncbi:hypothetical protein LCGC14_2876290 [marine sediment metagenome]|uniref:Uncharacterized protein n=1 Tax=marine sediment metagenome TaxID=412755 RepID=A0A0F8Y1D6_9ZZZZ
MNLTFSEKIHICKGFIARENLTEIELKQVITILNTKITEATKYFNFRTLRKLIAFVQYDENKARELFRATTEIDEMKQIYLEVVKKSDVVKIQILVFMERTGRSRRTFFRIKKEVSVKVSRKLNADTKTNNDERGLEQIGKQK